MTQVLTSLVIVTGIILGAKFINKAVANSLIIQEQLIHMEY